MIDTAVIHRVIDFYSAQVAGAMMYESSAKHLSFMQNLSVTT